MKQQYTFSRIFSVLLAAFFWLVGSSVFAGGAYNPDESSITISIDNSNVCAGDVVTLTADVDGNKCGNSPDSDATGTIEWYVVADPSTPGAGPVWTGGVGNGGDPFSTNGTATTSYTFNPSTLTPGTYYIYYVINWSNANCPDATGVDAQTGTFYSPSYTTLTVEDPPTLSLSSAGGTDNQTVCQNTQTITDITYAIGGGGTGATVTGLPAGVTSSFSSGTLTISGTPTASGTFNYTVTTTGEAACSPQSLGGTITVNPGPTIAMTSGAGTDNQAVCQSTAITNITYTIGGSGTGSTVTWVPAGTPTGISVSTGATTTISGTPTVAGTYDYTVTTTGGSCGSVTATGTITVSAAPSAAAAGTDQTLAACATSSDPMDATPPAVGTGTWSCVSGDCGTITYSPDANQADAVIGGLVPGTNTVLEWTVSTPGCPSNTDQVTINTTVGPGCATYCTPSLSDGLTFSYNINDVSFGSLSNQAANSPTAYQDYTASTSCIAAGTATVNFDITGDTYISGCCYVAMNVCVLIDWNGDGDFADADEVVSSTITGVDQLTSLVATVPGGALIDSDIRVRIILSTAACSSNGCPAGTGQTHDYTLVIASLPIADAGPNQTITCSSSASLDASASSPATGFWSLVSGTGTITDPSNPNSTVTDMSNGLNVFEWTSIGSCATDAAQVTIDVSGLPDEPVYAGLDVYTCTNPISLSASDPAPFGTHSWSVISQPGGSPAVSWSDITSPNSQISNLVNGTYVLEWSVQTLSCGTITDQVQIEFGSLPLADAGTDIVNICPTSSNLSGNQIAGLSGTWTQTGGAPAGILSPNNPNTLIYDLAVGSYEFTYTLSGGGCPGTTSDAINVTVVNCTTTVAHNANSDQVLTGCQYTYTDDGGAGNYSAGVSQTWTTFCPDDPNDFATLEFTSFNLRPGDFINIYDEPGPGAPVIATYYYYFGNPQSWVYEPALGSTITSSTGCLYVQFNSRVTSAGDPGWSADIGCSSTAGVQNQTYVNVENCGGGGGITICEETLAVDNQIAAESSSNENPPDLGIANSGCLGSGEGASNTWVYMTIDVDGWLTFSIDPAGGQDFDYAIWGPYDGGFACPGVTGDEPLRCTWATNGGAGCPANIGLSTTNTGGTAVLPSDVSENGSCAPASNEGWTYPIWGTAGEVYVLLFQNYGYNNSTFDFFVSDGDTPDGAAGSGNENYAGLGCDPPVALPIQLVSFTGENKRGENHLYWTTASEYQNAFFIIEKSDDGIIWEEFTTIQGSGTTSQTQNYGTVDKHPSPEITYYRLLQVDYDGRKRRYKTIAIATKLNQEGLFGEIYPNPNSGIFYFNYGGTDFNNEIVVKITNGLGQIVYTKTIESFNSSQSIEIDGKEFSEGLYNVEIVQGETKEVKRISVIR